MIWKKMETLPTRRKPISLKKNMPREMTFQWASLYGSLDPGHYRAVKWFLNFKMKQRRKRNMDLRAAELDFALAHGI